MAAIDWGYAVLSDHGQSVRVRVTTLDTVSRGQLLITPTTAIATHVGRLLYCPLGIH